VAEPETQGAASTEEDPGWPIGFMIFVGLAALYLGWRLIQLVGWLLGWLF
jgi:hypothetical protein